VCDIIINLHAYNRKAKLNLYSMKRITRCDADSCILMLRSLLLDRNKVSRFREAREIDRPHYSRGRESVSMLKVSSTDIRTGFEMTSCIGWRKHVCICNRTVCCAMHLDVHARSRYACIHNVYAHIHIRDI